MRIELDTRTVYLYNGSSLELEVINFPMGESHIRLPMGEMFSKELCTNVISRIRNSTDLIELILLSNALKNAGKELDALVIPYLPYSRQDRVAAPGDSFSLSAICSILDGLGYARIITIDVHSDVAAACFIKTRFINYSPIDEVLKFVNRLHVPLSEITLIAPDAGASKRTHAFMQLGFGQFMQCLKQRNPLTGTLDSFQCIGDVQTEYGLILDDICDGGGTFLGLGNALKERFKHLYLWTTHGGYTKGFDSLLSVYDRLGCTTSYRTLGPSEANDSRIKQIPIDYNKIIKL